MSVQKELDQIKNAVYGKEVRGAIHDGIKKAYDDASKNGNANMEVSLARGKHPTLNGRLEKLDQETFLLNQQLADKASKNELKIERARIDVITNLPGGSTTNDARLEDIKIGVDGKIYDSPANAVRTQIADVERKIDTGLINRVKNGDFSNGTTDWTSYRCTLEVVGAILKATTIQTSTATIIQRTDFEIGRKIFFKLRVKSNTDNRSFRIRLGSVIAKVQQAIKGEWIELSGTVTTTIANPEFQIDYYMQAGTEVFEVDGKTGVVLLDITSSKYTEDILQSILKYSPFFKKELPLIDVSNFMLEEYFKGNANKQTERMFVSHSYTSLYNQNFIVFISTSVPNTFIGYKYDILERPVVKSKSWKMDSASLYEYDGGSFTPLNIQIVNSGEWDCAIQEQGASDFIGGYAHGYEENISLYPFIDGKVITDLTTPFVKECKEFSIINQSKLYRHSTTEHIANLFKKHTFTTNGLEVFQTVEFLQALTMESSYLFMIPVARETGGKVVTNKGIKDRSKVYDLSAFSTIDTERTIGVKTFSLFNNSGTGYNVKIDGEVITEQKLPNNSVWFVNSPTYNKVYNDFCGTNHQVFAGDLWQQHSKVKITY